MMVAGTKRRKIGGVGRVNRIPEFYMRCYTQLVLLGVAHDYACACILNHMAYDGVYLA